MQRSGGAPAAAGWVSLDAASPDGGPAAPARAEPQTPSPRLPSLDGLRAVAIALVVVGHAASAAQGGRFLDPPGRRLLFSVVGNGSTGVLLFFVVSGFLITRLLLAERQRTGRIGLGRFYVRRAFRICPAFYVYLEMVALLSTFRVITVDTPDLARAATFTFIYHLGYWNWYVAHAWSLSVEEQFYLLWPAALAALGRRRAAVLAAGVIAVMPLARLGFARAAAGSFAYGALYAATASRLDVLMCGCLAALLWDAPRFRRALAGLIAWRVPPAAVVVGLATAAAASTGAARGPGLLAFQDTIEAAAAALAVAWVVVRPHSWAGRLLNARPLVRLGLISYSLYLWQQLFLSPWPFCRLQTFPLNVAAALLAGWLSYALVERPMIRYRVRRFGDPSPSGPPL